MLWVGLTIVSGLLLYGYWRKKKMATVTAPVVPVAGAAVIEPVKPYTIQITGDKTNAVYLVVDGLKSAFVSEAALLKYGYMQPTMVTQAQADAIPSKGWVGEDGKIAGR